MLAARPRAPARIISPRAGCPVRPCESPSGSKEARCVAPGDSDGPRRVAIGRMGLEDARVIPRCACKVGGEPLGQRGGFPNPGSSSPLRDPARRTSDTALRRPRQAPTDQDCLEPCRAGREVRDICALGIRSLARFRECFTVRVESQLPSHEIASVGQGAERGRKAASLDAATQVFAIAGAHAVDEVLEVADPKRVKVRDLWARRIRLARKARVVRPAEGSPCRNWTVVGREHSPGSRSSRRRSDIALNREREPADPDGTEHRAVIRLGLDCGKRAIGVFELPHLDVQELGGRVFD